MCGVAPDLQKADQAGDRCAGTGEDAIELLECEASHESVVGTCIC